MSRCDLIGYMRKSTTGTALKLNLHKRSVIEAKSYAGRDGEEYIGLTVSLDKVRMLIADQKEVTSICQIETDPVSTPKSTLDDRAEESTGHSGSSIPPMKSDHGAGEAYLKALRNLGLGVETPVTGRVILEGEDITEIFEKAQTEGWDIMTFLSVVTEEALE